MISVKVQGEEAAPVLERVLIEQSLAGKVRRVVLVETPSGYALWVQTSMKGPITVEKFRGGVRTWSTLDSAVRWMLRRLPASSVVELHLGDSSARR